MERQEYAWRRQTDAGACQTCPDATGHNRGDEPAPAWAERERSLPPAWTPPAPMPAWRRRALAGDGSGARDLTGALHA